MAKIPIKIERKQKPADLDTALECITTARKILVFYDKHNDLPGARDIDDLLNKARVGIELARDPLYLEKKYQELKDGKYSNG